MTDEGLVIHMFVENKYPLKKEVMSQLIELKLETEEDSTMALELIRFVKKQIAELEKLKLETEEDSTMALELIRFVKKQIAELEPKDSDGDEEDP
ncbi:hypothetical protein Tco_0078946 [Tanacetum coccineum]